MQVKVENPSDQPKKRVQLLETETTTGDDTKGVKEAPKKRGRPKKVIAETVTKAAPKIEEPESSTIKQDSIDSKGNEQDDPCPVCFEQPLHPVKLPCGHTYCFLCAKGLCESNIMSNAGTCSLCRSVIPPHFFRHPQVHADQDVKAKGNFFWYYEGRNGWWRFDERNNADLESSYQEGKEMVHFLICGNMYVIDFKNMVQYRLDMTGRVRSIKRECSEIAAKGVAGLVSSK